MYKLRGHHLFCLLGYRGMGYSEEYVRNMTQLHQTLREKPKTKIKIIGGPDELCKRYPNSGKYHCKDDEIYKRDQVILDKLEIKVGQNYSWEDIESRIRNNAVPSDIQTICESCSWRSYGVCEEGIQEIQEGKGLRKIE